MIDRILSAIPAPEELTRLFWLAIGWGCVVGALCLMGAALLRREPDPEAAATRVARMARDLQTLIQQRDGYRRQCERLAQELRAARLQAGYEAAERAVLRVQLALFRKGGA